MKKLLTLFTAACLLTAALTGCTTPTTTAYKVTSATYTTVDAAMSAWNDYVVAYHPTHDQELVVAKAYKTWQAASIVVVNTVKASIAANDTTGAAVNATVAAVSSALTGLIDALKPFGINLSPSVP